MPRKYIHNLKSRVYRKPDPQNMAKAIEAVESKRLSLRGAAAEFNIHYSVINRHMKNKGSIKSHGGQTVLNANEEAFIVDRLKISAEWGYPLDSFGLRMLIKEYLDASGKHPKQFKNNTPGKDFAYSFLNRHKKDLSERLCQNIKRNRAAVSRETLSEYFLRLETEIKDVPPENIVNYDETNLRDDPGRKKVIVKRGCKYPERIMNSSKSSTSLMFSAAGDGTILPVYVVYKAVNLYDSWTAGGPKFARYNRTKSGWFDSLSFEDWVRTVAVPYLKNLNGKKFLIGDNLSSHISMEVIKLCSEHDIHFIFLPSNSTHLTQPLDVAFFAPLKRYWKQILEKWKLGGGRSMSTIPKDKFPRLLKSLMNRIEVNGPINVIAGFKKCGIVPVDKEVVSKMLPNEPDVNEASNQAAREKQLLDDTFINLLKAMRYEDTASAVKPKKKSKISILPGKSVAIEDFCDTDDDEVNTAHEPFIDLVESDSNDMDCEIGDDEIEEDENNETEIYPFQVKTEELKTDDWLVVKFFYSTSNKCRDEQKPSTSKGNQRSFIGKITNIFDATTFEATFLRVSSTKDFNGLVYRYPQVEDVTKFSSSQIIGKLRLPETYKRGLLKFDFKC